MNAYQYKDHIDGAKSLVTSHEATRAGFISLALEKNRKATPFIEEAKFLKITALKANKPSDLLGVNRIRNSLLTAAGISDKAAKHLNETDRIEAIKGLIDNFLEPAGTNFVDELVFRFLLTRGDTLGGSMRNLAGSLGERKLSRGILSALTLEGRNYEWLHSKSRKWIEQSPDDSDIELNMKGLHWLTDGRSRTLLYNLNVPIVKKNVDLCLFDNNYNMYNYSSSSCQYYPKNFLALGELKGGIDPAGADEHWKTAVSALNRIRNAFTKGGFSPYIFFVGAAIELSMAEEMYQYLQSGMLDNAANLTKEEHIVSICNWLINI